MLLQQALKKCETDYVVLKDYLQQAHTVKTISTNLGSDLNQVKLATLSELEKLEHKEGEPEDVIVGKFVLTIYPAEDLWITDNIEIEFSVPGVYPADPPNIRMIKEPSARSLIGRTSRKNLPSIDPNSGSITSKLLSRNGTFPFPLFGPSIKLRNFTSSAE